MYIPGTIESWETSEWKKRHAVTSLDRKDVEITSTDRDELRSKEDETLKREVEYVLYVHNDNFSMNFLIHKHNVCSEIHYILHFLIH